MALLDMNDVHVVVETAEGPRTLVRLSSLSVGEGEMVGLVGETGSGKTLTGLSVTRVFPTPAISLAGGEILFGGRDLTRLDEASLRRIRGREIAMVFQDPGTSLNPLFPVGEVLQGLVVRHRRLSARAGREEALHLLERVELPDPPGVFRRFPHELSGGMRQRVMIAMAIAGSPRLIIADEPTTALDVTVQAELLRLFDTLRREEGTAVLFITHNLGVVAHTSDRIAIMYAGDVVETGPTADVLASPRHPYTRLLLAAVPRRDARKDHLQAIRGTAVARAAVPSGCPFASRCPYADDLCRRVEPRLEGGDNRKVACHHWEEVAERA